QAEHRQPRLRRLLHASAPHLRASPRGRRQAGPGPCAAPQGDTGRRGHVARPRGPAVRTGPGGPPIGGPFPERKSMNSATPTAPPAAPSAWQGWYRRGRRDTWELLAEAPAWGDCWARLVAALAGRRSGGESVVLPAGRRPDQTAAARPRRAR